MSGICAPCGTWKSVWSAAAVARNARKFSEVRVDGAQVYWIETRPAENGRSVIMRFDHSEGVQECLPQPFSARSRVYEYGGGAYRVAADEIFFSHDFDQRIYHTNSRTRPFAVTEPAACRYADFAIDTERRRLVCVREEPTRPETTHALVCVGFDESREIMPLARGHDFYAGPCLSPHGSRLAWIAWNHPHMPWDATELWIADIAADGMLANAQRVAGGPHESVLQPVWRDEGCLLFVSDRSGWWNLYAYQRGRVKLLQAREAEFAAAPWVLGLSNYGVAADGTIVCSWQSHGVWKLTVISPEGKGREIPLPVSDISCIAVDGATAAFIGAGPKQCAGVYTLDIKTARVCLIRSAGDRRAAKKHFSQARVYEVSSSLNERVPVFFYPPYNTHCCVPEHEKPPLIINAHGGPTGAVSAAFNEQTQFWTSRGFSVADVNYRGSTGYGRHYRELLHRQWGIVDVEDCQAAARFLIARGLVDAARIIIRGRSAGGLTVLNGLRKSDVFCCGTVYYGVSDLCRLAEQTHKFESRYLDWLVGVYPLEKQAYQERSPFYHTREIRQPILFFQGLDDRVVPASQTEQMVGRLKKQKRAVGYLSFSGESHGFRQAETLRQCLESEWLFYCRILKLKVPDELSRVSLPGWRKLPRGANTRLPQRKSGVLLTRILQQAKSAR